jgi:hypothetical protein
MLFALAAVTPFATAAPAAAQSITGLTATKNAGNSPDFFQNDLTVGRQRTTTVGILTNTGQVARVRYQEVVGVDVGTFSGENLTQASDYNVNFNVSAPGAYDLQVTTSLNGAFTIVDDGDGPANADATAVTGTQSGGTLASGGLGLTDPGSRGSAGDTPFTRTSAGVIQGTSNGSPIAHSLRFTWSASCSSSNGFLAGGDECAVRLGLTTSYDGETASDYPGVGGRVQANDGHFVSITLVSLCGNGVVDGSRGEQCDLGGIFNGTPGACCSTSCQLLPNGATCRASAGVCDLTETCNGSSPTCPADAKSTALCRASAGVCDVAEFCNGVNNFCPGDGFVNPFTVCRPAAGDCDVAENCPGNAATCPADAKRANGFVCRFAAGNCDVAEACDGSGDACPADALVPNGTVCRGAGDVCDVAESCDGSNPVCPANAVAPNSTVCRSAAGVCDEVENCDGVNIDCPADAFLGSTSGSFVCRPSAGPCDVQDLCNGTGPDCPADAVAPGGTVCRPSAGVCDLIDTCDGANTACPADAKSTAVCRTSAGVCDVAESCDGAGNTCPADAFQPATTVCRPSAGTCDLDETCTGSGATCPADTGLPDTDSDAVCDALDNCDVIANPSQTNADADALGDACDPCTNLVPTGQEKVKLTLTKLLAPANDDKLTFKGFFTSVPGTPTIDPVTKGLRVLITESTGATPVDVTIPGGAYDAGTKTGWRVNGSGTAWTYKGPGTTTNGLQKAQLKTIPSTPGKYKFSVKGKNGSYPINAANLPLVGTIVIDVPFASSGQCGEASFTTPPASCLSASGGKTVKCK